MYSNEKMCVLDVETNSTDMWSGKIVCIGAMDVDNPNEILTFAEQREEETIIKFLQFFNRNKFKKIIGYNTPFDHQAVVSRCLKFSLPVGSFYDAEIVDVMQILKGKKYNYNKPGTLNQWSRYILNKEKLATEDTIPALYRQGKLDQILRYNRTDVELTYQIWKRINFVLEA